MIKKGGAHGSYPQAVVLAPGNQPRVRWQKRTSSSIKGTSISTPTTVARAAPDFRPKSMTAVAIATSK